MVAKKAVARAKKVIKKAITKPRQHKPTVKPAEVEVLEASDLILPTLQLPKPCPIRIEIGVDRVTLYVGQRDMVWSRASRKLVASGTDVCGMEGTAQEETVEEEMTDTEVEAYNKGCAEAVEEEQHKIGE